jgi:Arc/MetJ family transcription regulator
MRAHVEIDDILLAQARRVTGLERKSELVNEALRQLVLRAQVDAIEALKGSANCARDVRTLRNNRELLEDLEDIGIAIERLKNPGRRLTMEEAEKELGLDG